MYILLKATGNCTSGQIYTVCICQDIYNSNNPRYIVIAGVSAILAKAKFPLCSLFFSSSELNSHKTRGNQSFRPHRSLLITTAQT